MTSPMTREDLQLLPMKIYEERRQMEIDRFVQRVHKEVLETATACRTSAKIYINTSNEDDFKLASAILFRSMTSPIKPVAIDEMDMVLSILKINLRNMYPDSKITSVLPSSYNVIHLRRGPHIIIDWS